MSPAPQETEPVPETKRQVEITLFSRETKYHIPEAPLLIPTQMGRKGLAQIVFQLLGIDADEEDEDGKKKPMFEFLLEGELIRSSMHTFMDAHNLSTENKLRIEVVEALPPPKASQSLPHEDWISSVSLDSASRFVLSGSYDGTVSIWDMSGKRIGLSSPGAESSIKSVSLFKENTEVQIAEPIQYITGFESGDLTVHEFNAEADETNLLFECIGHEGAINTIVFNGNRSLFATGAWDQKICLWTTTLEDLQSVQPDRSHSSKKQKSESSTTCIKTPSSVLEGHSGSVSCLGFSKMNPNTLFSGSWDHTLRSWDVSQESSVHALSCEKVITALDVSENSDLLVTGHADNLVRVWDPRAEDGLVVKLTFAGHTNWVSNVSWSPRSSYHILSSSYDGTVCLWDVRSSQSIWSKQVSKGQKLFGMDVNQDFVVVGGEDTKVHILEF